MLPLHIVGHAGCGKTTLIVDLVKALVQKNIRVGTIKHSAHIHELDKPGKDSFRHRTAGAAPVTMVTGQMSAIYLPRTEDTCPEKLLETYYKDVDIVLIEGWISGPFQKIEVWRESMGEAPLFTGIENVKALVSNDIVQETDLPIFPRSNIDQLVNFIITLV
ncbi:MAG: molybdopterin-guanine dinucleotide biosynthesis protein B [Proteobacteria bacterium]|nr:molybdopterin-guanine dinucleotide biosynthesis protein B [Pseudomonadota bacterium]MBU1586145.1 molybdopterin-guanine dinucleotide biosynthesis protein B [Pseudomonadota bacterium]MBU2627621.1 molybdopterin-guanine dinucleotide biosynthesis protein B [Pseudomonadota bacterium]